MADAEADGEAEGDADEVLADVVVAEGNSDGETRENEEDSLNDLRRRRRAVIGPDHSLTASHYAPPRRAAKVAAAVAAPKPTPSVHNSQRCRRPHRCHHT